MRDSEHFAYSAVSSVAGEAGLVPLLPISLGREQTVLAAKGLLDTGATVNVLPYSLGISLGADWDAQTTPIRLTGNLANVEARALIVDGVVGNFAPVRLAFAWTRSDHVPLILGQVNFFMQFDVCFHRSIQSFEVCPASEA